ncbi:MAG: hypothetical protein HY270_17180 [Deltaproteobacteria bacterium]|nr:hypothetical protein [Deltaproteobacteria bacterium]
MMRIVLSIPLIFLCTVACGLAEMPTPPAGSPAVAPTPESVTQTYGTLPATLEGSWLIVLQTQTAHGLVNNWNIYRIGKRDEAWRFQKYDRPQGTPLDALLAATNKDQKELVPSKEALEALKRATPTLKLLPENQTFRIVVMRTAENFVAEAPQESKDGKFSIEILDQTASNLVSAVQLFAKDVQANQIRGDLHATTIVASGMSVVPMQMSGHFKMLRLQ